VFLIWSSAYYTIYTANSIIEGIGQGNISPAVGDQLSGEALFVRAFTLFYLTNLFGDIPVVTTTDYRTNATLARSTPQVVYEQIIEDLAQARQLLPSNYVSAERTRPNKWSATALLSRVYLYAGNWADAEAMASELIGQPAVFELGNLSEVFLKGSKEAIWQLSSTYPATYNTSEGTYFILTAVPNIVAVAQGVIDAFEPADERYTNWIGTYSTDGVTYHYVGKYKEKGFSNPLKEHSVVLRLGEQYLIRAEARVRSGNLDGAQADINIIRARAGLANTTALSESELLLAIEQERRIELVGEWGHRWFDLKRTDRADAVLSGLKPNWNSEDVLLPIPESEILSNANLLPQNPGY
jgi:hypothetical protein